ncbi:hypothetical protein HMPREF9318_01926 [Streptococcus urinalis FB127-CNA-2]|uniref:Bacterial regulatory protein, GntR family n=1 Tax=Streptococcus urinalis 2285-97 TaxID=764291 RepID=G5KDA9_9STRE|nr:GntR family transcriptional regulator [Streptococcus urinalis]EHJ57616.1 bacterial regulatory protein, GntR family [Streptococcus urinalis 2285-97]EKS17477.1 hypothetical protein HMPREF9318_01926 [Streptococcus urinalis FB127-CNA-2]VEF32701.1 GntR family transcriptional regulator [Streptococcus urinalis]
MNDAIPIYLQIAQIIEDDIISGRYQMDDKVPSTNEFAKLLQINPATAGKGLNDLVNQEILYKKRGMGMFVTENARNIITKKRQHAFSHYLLPDFLKEAQQLDIQKDELIKMIEEIYDVTSD